LKFVPNIRNFPTLNMNCCSTHRSRTNRHLSLSYSRPYWISSIFFY